jgi:hypothetical protein
MSATFSINIGTTTESTRKPDIFSVLNDLQDNTQKLISPRDVRDAVLSVWANSPFKVTTPNSLNNVEYIGLDSSDPSNRDIKQKILLGKRNYGGLDIMSSSLLNYSDADIFLYNTKSDSDSQKSTKVAILAGTLSSLFTNAPYIESSVKNDETGIDLNVINPSPNGSINLLSTTGRVSINGVIFPTMAETSASASNGMTLRYRGVYPSGSLKWEYPTTTLNTIGSPGYTTNIYGGTVSVNGYPIEFIDNNLVSSKIGDIPLGFSFSENSFYNGTSYQNWPVTEVLREILYPYVPPVLSITARNTNIGTELNNGTNTIYTEVGVTTSISITYSLTTYARSSAEKISSYRITPGIFSGLSFSGVPGTTVGTASTYITSTYSSIPKTFNWVLEVSDSNLLTFSYSATASVQAIYPIYYGLTNSTSALDIVKGSLKKAIKPYPGATQSITLPYTGIGYLYIAFPSTFTTTIQQIQDPNGYIIHDYNQPVYSAFTYSNGTSNGVSYRVWRTKHICEWPGITASNLLGQFKFIF